MAASAAASGEAQQQLLSLIREFAAEKSHGERKVSDLKRRLLDLRAASDAAAGELDAAKSKREAAELELRGSQVQLAMATASTQALESRISQLQEKISKKGSDLDSLKRKGDSERDEFISQMQELNTTIRQFQAAASQELVEKKCSGMPSTEGQQVRDKNVMLDSGVSKDLIDTVSQIDAEVHLLEEEYQKELLGHHKIGQELAATKGKRALMESVMEEMKQLQELVLSLTENKKTAELEKVHASLGEELQRRYACPSCGANNMAELEAAEN